VDNREFSHLNKRGEVHMVDVSHKPVSARHAVAEGRIFASAEVISAVRAGSTLKGDVLAVARVAAIMAAKRTAEIVPLCHPVSLSGVECILELEAESIRVQVQVNTAAATGVEMEALTGVSAALLTLYDMLKSLDRGMHLGGIRLLVKTGGKSGRYAAPSSSARDDQGGDSERGS